MGAVGSRYPEFTNPCAAELKSPAMTAPMHLETRRRIFLICTLATAPRLPLQGQAPELAPHFMISGLDLRYELVASRLVPVSMLPSEIAAQPTTLSSNPVDQVEVELQVTGQNWSSHHAKKLIGGEPGTGLIYEGQRSEGTPLGEHITLIQKSPDSDLEVDSHYLFFNGIPVVRRWVRLINRGKTEFGIEHLSSAMLYSFMDFGDAPLESKTRIIYANNSWMSEGQWHSMTPSQLGFSENGLFNLSAITFGNIGSWSTMEYLPMGMVQNTQLGVTWFWQIEHNGAWHWEISNTRDRSSYLYLGGPDALYSQAWKSLRPGDAYESVPVAIGCLKGGFDDAIAALTAYRRAACLQPHEDNKQCPVIFNDYMNCLLGDPTADKETPLISAAAAAGCEYYVIDAGWYAELKENWWETVGLWQPSKTRWPNGLKEVLEQIRAKGMIPGLWLEIEVAGIKSALSNKPDEWFFCRHGKRVIDNGRYFLDFRNPEVRAYADSVVDRLVTDYGVGYIKLDYNVDALLGTELGSDSAGQGLLAHERAYLDWIDRVHGRYPHLVLENCGSGGGRMDYAMLSHHQLQSSSDQEDYRKYPSIASGTMGAVLPEQLGNWSYPRAGGNPDEASFNMVNAMLGRIILSGDLARLSEDSRREVLDGIRIYKETIRPLIPFAAPFFPIGLPSMADTTSPVAVGIRQSGQAFISVWRLAGQNLVRIPNPGGQRVNLVYPVNLGIAVQTSGAFIEITFPRPYMAALLALSQ